MSFPTVVARLRAAGCVFAEDEARLLLIAARSPSELDAMVQRRASGVPLELVIGWAEFHGLRIAVAPGVFVPRRRTEFLVDRAAALVLPGAIVVDLCCGTGAVGAALHAAQDRIELYAADIDSAAVRCARANLTATGARVHEGDLYAPLPAAIRGRVDMLVVNAPYVPTDEVRLMPPEARLYEAGPALDGGVDGLGVQRRVIAGAPGWLTPGGHLLIETSGRQAPLTAAAFRSSGLATWVARSEELDATVVIGRAPVTASGSVDHA